MKIHYVDSYLMNPSHPVTVGLVGVGGTGSQVLGSLARIDYALYKLGHPGLRVSVYDDDIVSESNIGRQLFSPTDVGLRKADVLVTRINSFFGTDWESKHVQYPSQCRESNNITITCVDNLRSRIETGEYLRSVDTNYDEQKPMYWIDFGNQTDRGQVVLGSIGGITQPESSHNTVSHLKCVDELFDLSKVDEKESGPSCSLAEALNRQDLFVNSFLGQVGCSLLWKLFTEGMLTMNGAYMNLGTMKVNPIKL